MNWSPLDLMGYCASLLVPILEFQWVPMLSSWKRSLVEDLWKGIQEDCHGVSRICLVVRPAMKHRHHTTSREGSRRY